MFYLKNSLLERNYIWRFHYYVHRDETKCKYKCNYSCFFVNDLILIKKLIDFYIKFQSDIYTKFSQLELCNSVKNDVKQSICVYIIQLG